MKTQLATKDTELEELLAKAEAQTKENFMKVNADVGALKKCDKHEQLQNRLTETDERLVKFIQSV